MKVKEPKDRRKVKLYSKPDDMEQFRGRLMHYAGLRKGKFTPCLVYGQCDLEAVEKE